MCRPYEKAGQFPMATLIRLAALGTFPLGGGRLSGGHMGPPLRQIENGCVFLVGAGPRPARPGFAPGALVRQSQAQILNRKCSKFCRLRPPVGPEGIAPEHSWFCAPEILCLAKGVTFVMGVRGKATMSTKCSSGAVPRRFFGDFLIVEKVTRRPQAAIPLRTTNSVRTLPPHPPQCAHWGTFPLGGRLRRDSGETSPAK